MTREKDLKEFDLLLRHLGRIYYRLMNEQKRKKFKK
jgi:hypothetical protein